MYRRAPELEGAFSRSSDRHVQQRGSPSSHIDDRYFINPAASQIKPAILGGSDIPNHASTRRNGRFRKLFCPWIKAYQRIRLYSRLAVPNGSIGSDRDA